MVRAASSDFLQGFRYHVVANDGTRDPLEYAMMGDDNKARPTGAVAGFQSVTIPELSVEASEYREGTFEWTQKYPGVPTISDITLIRGITKYDTAFYNMVLASIRGQQYRADVTIYHYQRAEMSQALSGTADQDVRKISCGECFATRAKADGDLEAMTGDISLGEVDLAVEHFEISPNIVPI